MLISRQYGRMSPIRSTKSVPGAHLLGGERRSASHLSLPGDLAEHVSTDRDWVLAPYVHLHAVALQRYSEGSLFVCDVSKCMASATGLSPRWAGFCFLEALAVGVYLYATGRGQMQRSTTAMGMCASCG